MKSFAKLAALMLIVALNSLPLTANAYTKIGTCSQKEKILVQKHITNQIAALKREDWETAYGYAALIASLIALIVKPRKLGFKAIMALAFVDVLLTAVAQS